MNEQKEQDLGIALNYLGSELQRHKKIAESLDVIFDRLEETAKIQVKFAQNEYQERRANQWYFNLLEIRSLLTKSESKLKELNGESYE